MGLLRRKKAESDRPLLAPKKLGFLGLRRGKERSEDVKGDPSFRNYGGHMSPRKGDSGGVPISNVTVFNHKKKSFLPPYSPTDENSVCSDLTENRTYTRLSEQKAEYEKALAQARRENYKAQLKQQELEQQQLEQQAVRHKSPPRQEQGPVERQNSVENLDGPTPEEEKESSVVVQSSFLQDLFGYMDQACAPPSSSTTGGVERVMSFTPEWGMAPSFEETQVHTRDGSHSSPTTTEMKSTPTSQPSQSTFGTYGGGAGVPVTYDSAPTTYNSNPGDPYAGALSSPQPSTSAKRSVAHSTKTHDSGDSKRDIHENFEMVLEEISAEEYRAMNLAPTRRSWLGLRRRKEEEGEDLAPMEAPVETSQPAREAANQRTVETKQTPKRTNKKSHKELVKDALFPDYNEPLTDDPVDFTPRPRTQEEEKKEEVPDPGLDLPPEAPPPPPARKLKLGKKWFNPLRGKRGAPTLEPVNEDSPMTPKLPVRRNSRFGKSQTRVPEVQEQDLIGPEVVEDIYRDLDLPNLRRTKPPNAAPSRTAPPSAAPPSTTRAAPMYCQPISEPEDDDLYDLDTDAEPDTDHEGTVADSNHTSESGNDRDRFAAVPWSKNDRNSSGTSSDMQSSTAFTDIEEQSFTPVLKEPLLEEDEEEEEKDPSMLSGLVNMISGGTGLAAAEKTAKNKTELQQMKDDPVMSKSHSVIVERPAPVDISGPPDARDLQRPLSTPANPTFSPVPPKRQKPAWKAAVDQDSGRMYYYHRLTRQTTWTQPEELKADNEKLSDEKPGSIVTVTKAAPAVAATAVVAASAAAAVATEKTNREVDIPTEPSNPNAAEVAEQEEKHSTAEETVQDAPKSPRSPIRLGIFRARTNKSPPPQRPTNLAEDPPPTSPRLNIFRDRLRDQQPDKENEQNKKPLRINIFRKLAEKDEARQEKTEGQEKDVDGGEPGDKAANSDQEEPRNEGKETNQDEIRAILATMEPPNGNTVDNLLSQYEGREADLLKYLRSVKESRPFDEPAPEKEATTEDSDGDQHESDHVAPMDERVRTTASIATKLSSNTRQSGNTKLSEKTQVIKNTARDRSIPENSIVEEEPLSPSRPKVGAFGHRPRPRVPSRVQTRRTRELEVEEFTDIRSRNEAIRARQDQIQNRRRALFLPSIEQGDGSLSNSRETDSVSALSMELEFSRISPARTRAKNMDAARRRALDDAIRREDWDMAAAISEGMRSVKRKEGNIPTPTPREWKQSELDKFISMNDWEAVSKYIAQMRSRSLQQKRKENKRAVVVPRNRSYTDAILEMTGASRKNQLEIPSCVNAMPRRRTAYDSDEEPNPRKRFGARSQLQHREITISSSSDEESSYYSDDLSSQSSISRLRRVRKYRKVREMELQGFTCR